MTLTKVSYQQPIFKDRVFFKFEDTKVEVRYRDRGCAIAIPLEQQQETVQLLKLLQMGGLSLQQLAQCCPGIQEQIPQLLGEFERRGMLVENQIEVNSTGVSGVQFYRELCRFMARLKQQFPPSPLSQQIVDGTISKNQLLGYALESYHVTHFCPRLLAPSLANYESPTTQKILQEFLVSELHHDHLLEKSLQSVGIDGEQLQQMQPLPMTFAVCSTLGVLAHQHPLSFKVALMLFEEDDRQFHHLFKQCCLALGMPREFYQPILLHARINEEGAHEQITASLLQEIPYVSSEERSLVKKNMAILMESMVLRTHEMLEYYGNPNNPVPRCFDSINN